MLHEFLDANRTVLIERCRAKVALRPTPSVISKAGEHGIPLFLGQLIETLRLEQSPEALADRISSGFSGPRKRNVPSEVARNAAKHGGDLLRQGYTVDQVVHDYGDLCQAITELSVEKNAPVSSDEFRTLNACLDVAIADAVTEYGSQRDQQIADRGDRAMSERLGFLAHELRNFLNTAMLSFAAIKGGNGFTEVQMRVLIADDSRAIRESLIDLLESVDGVEVVGQAKDGREANDLARRLKPDVTVLDVRMPVCSGMDVLAAIKQNDPTAIVIMLTTYADRAVRRKSFAHGADLVFDKGVELEQFMSALRRLSHFWSVNRVLPRAAHQAS